MRALLFVLSVVASRAVFAALDSGNGTSSQRLMAPGYAAEYLLGVVLVLIALAVFAWLLRRVQSRVSGGHEGLRVRASLPLGGKERLVIVQIQDETLLLGVSSGSVQLVSRLATPPAQPFPAPNNTWLARTLNKNSSNNANGGATQ
jgi:flagellar protein FliO/FliZ